MADYKQDLLDFLQRLLLVPGLDEVTVQELLQFKLYLEVEETQEMVKGWPQLLQTGEEAVDFLQRFPEIDAISQDYSKAELEENLSLLGRLLPIERRLEEGLTAIQNVRRQLVHELATDNLTIYGAARSLSKARPELKAALPLIADAMKKRRRPKEPTPT